MTENILVIGTMKEIEATAKTIIICWGRVGEGSISISSKSTTVTVS